MLVDTGKVFSLYRSFRREIRLLPTTYLRTFYKLKLNDDARAILETEKLKSRVSKFRRVLQEYRHLKRANTGIAAKFDHVLDVAYGRKGKLRWELINHILPDPRIPVPDRIISSVEKSRPPVYSQELSALLTSTVSHRSKHLKPEALQRPPMLPARADPNSDEARLLGPFSKRREVNLRWRFYTEQKKRVYPPLQLVVEERLGQDEAQRWTDRNALHRAGLRSVGMQGEDVFEEVEQLAARASCTSESPGGQGRQHASPLSNSPLQPRFLQRRFAHLLGRIPILTYSYPQVTEKVARSGPAAGKYQVSMSRKALHPSLRTSPLRAAEADDIDLAWIQAAENDTKPRYNAAKRGGNRRDQTKADRTIQLGGKGQSA